MRRRFTLQPNEKYPFVVGSSDNYLIMRNLTADIYLESDAFKDVVLSRSDTVVVTDYQDIELRLVNTTGQPITGEIQLSEVDIRIKEQRMSVDGGIVIDEIATPVTVSEVQAPVSITASEAIKVSITNNRHVRNWTTFTGSGSMYGSFKYVMIQASSENVGNVSFLGITIPPNGYYELNVPFDSSSESVAFDVPTDKANVIWIRDMNAVRSLPNRADSDAEYIIQGDERIHYLEWEKAHGME
ncbi:hypothetical protein RJD40_01635 [Vibrio scophthalmi]|uniref:hypothetical protein n=1 Tax=Vibrio scophthalmi TaxID=45658 RepID=UPI003AAD031D